jgi:hypothetical protein
LTSKVNSAIIEEPRDENNEPRQKRKNMKKLNIASTAMKRTYKNNGQHLEQKIRYFLTGEICKADNLEHSKGGDVLNYQVKSARATVCKGKDLKGYLDMDGATEYIYITKEENAYIMSREEYTEFVEEFGTLTRESAKNGGHEKIRLGHESKKMLEWLEERAEPLS